MADFKHDGNGDILIENGDFVLVTGAEAIQQAIEFELRVGLEECRYAMNRGTPWFQFLLDDGTTDEARRFVLAQIIRRVPGVIDVLGEIEIIHDNTTRITTITGHVLTVEGEITFNTDGTPHGAS